MQLVGLARLGADMEVRKLPNGTAVGQLSLAYHYGQKDQTGQRSTQWIEAALFGTRADAMAPYLKKGKLVLVFLDDIRVEMYQGKGGEQRASLKGRVQSIEFAEGRKDGDAPRRDAAPLARPQADAFDDDIPF